VTFCVIIVTTASSSIGSYFSGVFAFFPAAMGSFFIILHTRIGGLATASVASHVLTPLIGLGLGLLAVHFPGRATGIVVVLCGRVEHWASPGMLCFGSFAIGGPPGPFVPGRAGTGDQFQQ
jgi:hypothetical protein